jgi:acyl carrier protein
MLTNSEVENSELSELVIHLLQQCNIHPEVNLTSQNCSAVQLQDLAIDSIEMLQFSMLLEDQLNLDLDGVQFAPENTIIELVSCIDRLLSGRAK